MNTNTIKSFTHSKLLCACIGLAVVLPQGAFAANPVTLATAPLLTSTTSAVKPNILFTLDDSGSMNSDYTPDWAGFTKYASHPYLHETAEFNAQTYNPATLYKAPVKSFDTNGLPVYYDSQTSANTTGWTKVKQNGFDASNPATTDLISGNTLFYYTLIPGEFCDSVKLSNCQTTQTATFSHPATLRWCNNTNLATGNCRALYNTTSYIEARYSGMGLYEGTITVSGGVGSVRQANSIKVLNREILSQATAGTNNNNTVASRIAANINACTTNAVLNCQINGFSATVSGNVVTITSAHGGVTDAPVTVSTNVTLTPSTLAYIGNGPQSYPVTNAPGKRIRVAILPAAKLDSYPYPGTSAKHANRTDCNTGTVCTSAQEMTNYANWYAYYRTRMQSMKSGVGFAFQGLDDKFRVGFNVINYTGSTDGNKFLNVSDFTIAQKNSWYSKLAGTEPDANTPLRLSLSKMGRYFAGKLSKDPVQFSCQQNFGILSTDGYWNSSDPVNLNGATGVGNQDRDASDVSKGEGYWEGPTTTSDTLADTAMYYYKTDLRPDGSSQCTNPDYQGRNLCENNVFASTTDGATYQHMTTFTMGLGIDGNLQYIDGYQDFDPDAPLTLASGDFERMVKDGTPMWGNPITNSTEARIDDLWHAAVNGRGTYFSAKDPDSVTAGFRKVLEEIGSKTASSGGVAISSQTPTAGTDKAYKVGYTSNKWTGNVVAYTLLASGAISTSPAWCVENVLAEACDPPNQLGTNVSGQATCTRIGPFAACNAGETLDGSNCVKIIPNSCTGSLKARITAPNNDSRRILVNAGGSSPIQFDYSTLPAAVKPYFEQTYLTAQGLTQFTDGTLDNNQKIAASGANLVNYLRGRTQYDQSNTVATERYYRQRGATLGDVTDFRPNFVGAPVMDYTELIDPGYPDFKSDNATRGQTVFVGANDGMLHAFNGADGAERWAFIPTAVMSKMWTLADTRYATKHVNLVDGKSFQADVNNGGGWRTIIVSGMGNGGKGYFALDVTDPSSDPKVLWELSATQLPNSMGYAYGRPIVTKVKNGSGTVWAALLPSGYNNVDGAGYLFVVDAMTGSIIRTITTSGGSPGFPSGLSEVNTWIEDRNVNSQASVAYGGDLNGKVWRFDLDNTSATSSATVLADFGASQPITTSPELGKIQDFKVVFIGTGKYLETGDLSTTSPQSFYAIADKGTGTVTRSNLIAQTITSSVDRRTSTNNPVNWTNPNVYGWRVDFPDVGERVNVNPYLVAGMLFVLTTVPIASDCAPGGYSWFNYLNYETGGNIVDTTYTGVKLKNVAYDLTVYIQDGKLIAKGCDAGGTCGEIPDPDGDIIKQGGGTGEFDSTRLMWRELVQ